MALKKLGRSILSSVNGWLFTTVIVSHINVLRPSSSSWPNWSIRCQRRKEGRKCFIPQSIVTLNTNLQAVAHKTITVYLSPRSHFNFNTIDLPDVIDQVPFPFILMGDFNGHHTLWGCKEVNNRGQQLENLDLPKIWWIRLWYRLSLELYCFLGV